MRRLGEREAKVKCGGVTLGGEGLASIALEELLDHLAPARARVGLGWPACSVEQVRLLHSGAPNRDQVCRDGLADGFAHHGLGRAKDRLG